MRRRRTLIDDYLRDHDPLGSAADGVTPEATAIPDRNRFSTWRRISLPGLAIATTFAVIFALAFMPGRATRNGTPFLTPEAAVAAASISLKADQILHWRYTMGSVNRTHRAAREEWFDLGTGANAVIIPNASTGGRNSPSRTWYNGRRTTRVQWPSRAFSNSDDRWVIVRTVRRRGEKVAERDNPISALRKLLAAAARGEAELAAAPPENGVPVVRVRQVKRHPRVTIVTTTSFTREATPRHLRTVNSFRSPDGTPNSEPVELRVQTWELLPRTPENLAKVQPPRFDPKEYKVVTQFLGPRKR